MKDSATLDATKHTPGPWVIDRDDRPDMEWNNHIVQAARPHIAICFMTHSGKKDNSEAEANASLIAAAPDLLAALQQLLDSGAIWEKDEPIARAAIKKALGK